MLFQHSDSADVELGRGCIGNFGRCEKRYGVDPIFFRVKQRSGHNKKAKRLQKSNTITRPRIDRVPGRRVQARSHVKKQARNSENWYSKYFQKKY